MKKLLTGPLVLFCSSAFARDVTQLVITYTDFDERIANACARKCGNQGFSKLQSVDISPSQTNIHQVEARVVAQYHEYSYPVNVLGTSVGGGTFLKFTINAIAYGSLDTNTCYVTITRVDVIGDQLGIANGAKKMEGDSYYLNNCRQLI